MASSGQPEEGLSVQEDNKSSVSTDQSHEWDEARLEEAMARLQDMYRQVRELRGTIPRLLEPLTTLQPSPEALQQKLSKSVTNANEDLRKFKDIMDDDFSSQVMNRAKESRTKDPKGIKAFKLYDHPDWNQT